MNQWQRAVNSSSDSQHITNARRRLTPAHIAVGVLQTPTRSQEIRHIAVGAIQTPPRLEDFRNAEVVSTPIQGRHVVASKVVEQGTSIFSEEPFVHEIDGKWIGKRCSFCLGANTTIACRQCSFHRYCSTSCESSNWTSGLHSMICNLYGIFDSDMMLVLKAFTKSSFDQRTMPFCFSQGGKEIPCLVSNIDYMSESDIKAYTVGAQLCADLFYWPKESVQLLVKIMAQIRCNRFAIKATVSTNTAGGMVEHQETAVGSAVYAQTSMFNHSCAPNAYVTFDGPRITVRCSETVLKGKEINISYGPVATRHSTLDRQKELTEKYCFLCNCHACLQSEQGKGEVYRCPSGNDHCKIYRSDTLCPSCGRPIDWATIDLTEKQAKKLRDTARTVDDLLKALDIERQLYPKDSLRLGSTYDELAAFYAHRQDFNTAAKYCTLSNAIVVQNYGQVSIESADEQFKLVTLLFNGYQSEAAYKAIKKCMELFRTLGLDQARKDDMKELQEMMNALGVH
ncbi:hypothetical protein K450DRAFT_226245 [Umbelopsis ramanniana AG]|uniref:SET domain-containing protein n=1 Tax=Umbelopsis ramanniana AG TaxID=1314678 RepID=A0AAD5EFQ9_UMBRA|nr:uncharacterized protein K450DRAFT_226245 [Umbelopsis ramanniana AG]KAI8582639.1 hypothetical protein K450DRAFT_226245 [Umbelopsis ramanniana AG]